MPDLGDDMTHRTQGTNASHSSPASHPSHGSFIPPHGGYQELLSYQKALVVYQATLYFCDRYIEKRSRTHDQFISPIWNPARPK
jgi:hypothetical protein